MRTPVVLFSVLLATACVETPSRRAAAIDEANTSVANALIRGDAEGALARAERALARYPGDPWLLYNQGTALAALGRTEPALVALREAERRFPRADLRARSVAIYGRALALEFSGHCAEASTELASYAAMMRPSQPELAADALAHMEYCIRPTAEQAARERQAADLSADAMDAVKQRTLAASTESVRAMIRGDYTTALQQANQGLQAKPDDAWLLYNKGVSLAALGMIEESLEALQASERQFSPLDRHGRGVASYGRALVLETVGRCDEAAKEYQRYASIVGLTEPLAATHVAAHLRICRLAASARETF